MIGAITKSNKIRKDFLVKEILKMRKQNIGIYKLAMKSGSDNWRESSIIDIIYALKKIIKYFRYMNQISLARHLWALKLKTIYQNF